MKTHFTMRLIAILMPITALGQLSPSQLQLNATEPGTHLKNIIQDHQIEEIALVRPFGWNTDTTRYPFEPDSFLFGKRLLAIGEEVIRLDSIDYFLVNADNQTLTLRSRDKGRHYNRGLKHDRQLLEIIESRKDETKMLGKVAPDFTAITLSGKEITLSELRGKVVLLNFWFLGCMPCQKEFPDLNKLTEEYPEVEIVSVALNEKPALLEHIEVWGESHYKLSAFYSFFGDELFYEIIPNGEKIIAQYNFTGYPINFFIDQEGLIRSLSRYTEPRPKNYEKLSTELEKLLH